MTIYPIPRDHDFTFPDYDSIFSRLTSAIGSVLSSWTNYLRASFENILLGNECFNFDVVMGYLEQRIGETRLATVIHRATARRMARTDHYYIAGEKTAATTTATLDIGTATAGDVTFPVGTPIFTTGPNRVSGQLTEAKTIVAGLTSVDGPWEHSESVPISFTGTGLPRQRYPLERAPYLWESAVLADGADDWIEIEYFTDYGATDKVFRVEMDEDGYAELVFGNGTYGAMPSGAMTGSHRIGGGLDGNVASGSLTRVGGSFTDSLGNPVAVTCTNAERASGGDDQESVELITLKAPAAGKTQERSVGRPDQESNAERVSAVASALVLTAEERVGIPENTGHVYLVGYGTLTNSGRYRPVAATATNKSDVHTMLTDTYPVPNTFTLIEQDTVFNEVNFVIRIGVATGYTFADVAQSIYDALDDFFAVSLSDADGKGPNTSMGFGEQLDNKLKWHVLFNEVRDVDGIDTIDEDQFVPVNEVALETYEFPKLGSVRIYNSLTGSYLDF